MMATILSSTLSDRLETPPQAEWQRELARSVPEPAELCRRLLARPCLGGRGNAGDRRVFGPGSAAVPQAHSARRPARPAPFAGAAAFGRTRRQTRLYTQSAGRIQFPLRSRPALEIPRQSLDRSNWIGAPSIAVFVFGGIFPAKNRRHPLPIGRLPIIILWGNRRSTN